MALVNVNLNFACIHHAGWAHMFSVCVLYNLYGCCTAFFCSFEGIKAVSVVVAPFQPQLTKTTIVTKNTGWNQTKIHWLDNLIISLQVNFEKL